jgi:glucose-6-phosphate 1-dehydrogenase
MYAVRGQYGPGVSGRRKVPGYREEQGVKPDSNTETYAALKLFVDNWRWQDIPFYIRTGKRLNMKRTEVVIHFRPVPHKSFPAGATTEWQSPCLIMSIQPDEGIVLNFLAKQPGTKLILKPVSMLFNYNEFLLPVPDAYETLLWDVMNDDATLFMRSDQVTAAWQIIMPVLRAWSSDIPSDFPNYAAGTAGPAAANDLLAKGHYWPVFE